MEAVEMTVINSGNKFYGMVDHNLNDVYMKEGWFHFNSRDEMENFLKFNKAKETEMVPENFNFFKM